jgi:hypothetical protein
MILAIMKASSVPENWVEVAPQSEDGGEDSAGDRGLRTDVLLSHRGKNRVNKKEARRPKMGIGALVGTRV